MSTVERDRRTAGGTAARTPVEMPHWSDLTGPPGPCGGRAAVTLLARAVSPLARVLVAGPHEPALVAGLPVPPERITWLLRSRHDAVDAARAAGAEVVCGGPEAVAGRSYDVIVALDGLDRVVSAEGPQAGWVPALDALAALLAPGGLLLLGVANPLGVHELTALTPTPHEAADRHWHAPAAADPDRPGSPDRLRAVLARDGLTVRRLWLGYPDPLAPVLLLDPEACGPDAPGGMGAAVDLALAGAWAGRDGAAVLSDPHTLAADALANGLGSAFAPLWLVAAVRPSTTVPQADTSAGPGIPEGSLATSGMHPGHGPMPESGERPAARSGAVLPELIHAEPAAGPHTATWTFTGAERAAVTSAAPDGELFGITRDVAAVAGPVPAGPGFERVLRDACRRRDTPRVRALLAAYADWLRGRTDEQGQVAGAYACTGLDGLALSPGGPAVLDPSWSAGPRPLAVVLARTLHRFAERLLTGGAVHPWPSTLDAAELTLVLVGAAGERPDPAAVTAAVEFDADLRAAAAGLDQAGRDRLARRAATVGTGTAPDVAAYRELLLADRRLRGELEHARGVAARAEQQRRAAEEAARAARQTVAQLKGSASFRLGRALLAPARWARGAARRFRRR
ncbi:class I SAM-dependent methyltransferase [Catellatospora bangladeshensis]|uniref:Uncharacterized protein n=1 Tax=Catellatospora bangladeshensis TaxID=310355 RepID=A0A8J3JFI3_9ACTN|nr:class I SAM-dependent methyltransferase [Catellatospora bangladeshensis]GIF84002.1 hypothetical protein Cba03nite_53510 [Catellatospora bangladeshensis]